MDYITPYRLAAAPALLILAYIFVPYLANSSLRKYPGPLAAATTRLWTAYGSRYGVRSIRVDEQHRKLGFVIFDGKANLRLMDFSLSQQVCEDWTERDLHRRPRRAVSPQLPPHFLPFNSSSCARRGWERAGNHRSVFYNADCVLTDPSSTLTAPDRSSRISTTPSLASSEDSSTLAIERNTRANARSSPTPSVSARWRNSSRTSVRRYRRCCPSGMR